MVADMKAAMGDDGAEWACEGHSEKAWRAVARAALLAIREPDSAMFDAADRAHVSRLAAHSDNRRERVWTAMIDAILNEKPEGGE